MTVTLILALVLAVTFCVHGALMILAVPIMRTGAASVGFTVTQYRGIGILEVAAAVGLMAGLAVPALGAAAGAGLILLMTAAVIVHVRAGDPLVRMAPAVVLWVMAIGYFILVLPTLRGL